MNHLFFAWTPLQIINIINVYQHYFLGEESTLILYRSLDQAEELQKRMREIYPQLKVHVLDDAMKDVSSMKKMAWLVRGENPYMDEKIQQMYISGDTYFVHLFYAAGKKLNPDMKLNYIEDGMGAYTQAPIIYNDRLKDKIKNRLNSRSIYRASYDYYYLYRPDLVKNRASKQVRPIPILKDDNPATAALSSIFDLQINHHPQPKEKKTKLIYLDQPFSKDQTAIDEFELYDQLKIWTEEWGIPLYLKLHPRQDREKYEERGAQIIESSLPWELFILEEQQEVQWVPIAVNSTALFSSPIMFGRNLPAIALTEMVLKKDQNRGKKTMDILTKSLKSIQTLCEVDGMDLYSVENKEELKEVLKTL